MMRMGTKVSISVLIILFACSEVAAQKTKRPVGKKPSPRQAATDSKYDAYPFALPIEARIGFHRMTEPGIFITLKNLGSRLTIQSIGALVMVADPIKLDLLKSHTVTFKFAAPIGPGSTGESVVTSEDSFNVRSADLVPARCKDYKADKDDPAFFMPNACISGQDFLIVSIFMINYTDGSTWIAPARSIKK